MKKKTDICHLSTSKDKSSEIHLGESIIRSSDYENLQDITIDSKCHFWWSCWRSLWKSYSSSNPLLNSFLKYNLITAHWFRCHWFRSCQDGNKIKMFFMKDICELWKMTNCHLMRNSWKKMEWSLFVIKTFRVLL